MGFLKKYIFNFILVVTIIIQVLGLSAIIAAVGFGLLWVAFLIATYSWTMLDAGILIFIIIAVSAFIITISEERK